MKKRIILTPMEPYFFGNDRTFSYGELKLQRAGSYFISSEYTPSQTTLFGVLRYLGIREKSRDFHLTEEDQRNIGSESYTLDGKSGYGRIRSISPLYLMDLGGHYYIRTPLDHRNGGGKKQYTPFSDYRRVESNRGSRLIPMDYRAKDFLTEGYMETKSGTLLDLDSIFRSEVRVGINKRKKRLENGNQDDSFFKKEYRFMEKHSFVFFADLEEGFPEVKDRVVYMGQGKSAFRVRIDDELEPAAAEPIQNRNNRVAYALSDLYVKDPGTLYEACDFSIVKTRSHRTFTTNYEQSSLQVKRFRKRETGITLIEAGSLFLVKNQEAFEERINNQQARIAGFNIVIYGGKNESTRISD